MSRTRDIPKTAAKETALETERFQNGVFPKGCNFKPFSKTSVFISVFGRFNVEGENADEEV